MKSLTAFLILLSFVIVGPACLLPSNIPHNFSATEQYESTVLFTVACMDKHPPTPEQGLHIHYGSGVIVDAHHAITAAHVAMCEDTQTLAAMVVSTPGRVKEMAAEPDLLLLKNDIARVRFLWTTVDDVPLIRIGPRPAIGDTACVSFAKPQWARPCGPIQPSSEDGSLYTWIFTQHGNSGGGVWVDGKLVGLLVTAHYCESMHACMGGITPLQGLDYLVQ